MRKVCKHCEYWNEDENVTASYSQLYKVPTRIGICNVSYIKNVAFVNAVLHFDRSVNLPQGALRSVNFATIETYGCNQWCPKAIH